jgi:tetratricopeptide (TPR) repeat protein
LQRLEEADERGAAERMHSTYYADLAEEANALLEGPSVDVWLDRFSAEHDNLRAVVHRSLKHNDPDYGLRTVGNAWRFYHRRGHLIEAQTALQALLASDNVSPAAKSTGMSGLASVTYWLGDYQSALEQYLEVLHLSREVGDRLMEAETLFALSTTSSFLNDFEEGTRYAELAKEAYEDAGAVDEVRRVLSAHAIAVWVSGDLPEAERRWQEVTMAYEEAGDRGEALQSRVGVAAIAHQLGRTDEALQKLGETLGEIAAMGDITGTLTVLDTISMVLASRDPESAIRLAGATAAMREDLGGGFTLENYGVPTAREVAANTMAEPTLEALWVEGSRLDLDAAIELGREITGISSDGATRADIRTED